MPATVVLVFVILALVLFLFGAVNVQLPASRQIGWVSAGLALLTLAWLIGRS